MKPKFLMPLLALTTLATEAFAKAPPASDANDHTANPVKNALAATQLEEARAKGLVIYQAGDDAFAFTLVPAADGTLVAQHRSHYSHGSHSSHSSHSSHYSGR
jgi:hypothetical protein